MAELATIARPYAEALFQVVKADAAQAAQWLDGLAVVAKGIMLYSMKGKMRREEK